MKYGRNEYFCEHILSSTMASALIFVVVMSIVYILLCDQGIPIIKHFTYFLATKILYDLLIHILHNYIPTITYILTRYL